MTALRLVNVTCRLDSAAIAILISFITSAWISSTGPSELGIYSPQIGYSPQPLIYIRQRGSRVRIEPINLCVTHPFQHLDVGNLFEMTNYTMIIRISSNFSHHRRRRFLPSRRRAQLYIRRASYADSGIYVCTASNAAGSTEERVQLQGKYTFFKQN